MHVTCLRGVAPSPVVPAPLLCYLRVYEPLRVFLGEAATRVRAALASGPVPAERAGERDRELCLRSQLAVPTRLLPGERADGTPLPNAPLDVLVADGGEVGDDTLVCPLDTRPRAAAALMGFLTTEPAAVRRAALSGSATGGLSESAVRARAEAVVAELGPAATHVVSATWTVPLPWFTLVEPAARVLTLTPRHRRRVYWRAPIGLARRRAEAAHTVVAAAFGDEGPARVLRDTGRWLARFDEASVVELDYGGLVHLLDDDALRGDTSAADVHGAVQAIQSGDSEQAATCYRQLRGFWSVVAAHEHAN